MHKFLQRVLRLFSRFLSHFPTPLPVGASEFDAWSTAILDLSGRYANEDSMRFALATMVIHADAKYGSLPKSYFVTRLRKTAANQVASQVFQDIKNKQKAAEVTTAQTAVVNDTGPVQKA